MYEPSSIQPGIWANVATNIEIESADGSRQDIVKSPIFIMSRENTKSPVVMFIDQNLNHLNWYDFDGQDKNCPQGVVCGSIDGKLFQAKMRSFTPVQNVDLADERIKKVMQAAVKIRQSFVDKNPDMAKDFFQLEQKQEAKPLVEAPVCSITHAPLHDPVTGPDGRNYERSAIVKWLEEHGTSPFTGEPMSVDQLITNFDLRPAE